MGPEPDDSSIPSNSSTMRNEVRIRYACARRSQSAPTTIGRTPAPGANSTGRVLIALSFGIGVRPAAAVSGWASAHDFHSPQSMTVAGSPMACRANPTASAYAFAAV